MKMKHFFPLFIAVLFVANVAESQVIMMQPRPPRYRARPPRRNTENLPRFQPSLNVSLGYGFPNVDKVDLPAYLDEYNSGTTQTGPFTGSVDYRFSRLMSIGVLVTHGMLNAPYYPYSGTTGTPDFNFKVSNWAFMIDLMHYMQATNNITLYSRVALGVNTWTQNYIDPSGNKMNVPPASLPDLAYQVGLGAQFKMTKNSGFFLEAGYGKYILNGGLTFKL
jgi:hypothetical protein